MTIPTWTWERRLSALAHEPLKHNEPYESIHVDGHVLDLANAHCATLTQAHSKTFYTASALLPLAKRRAVRALYAFCRVSDDLVDDRSEGDKLALLNQWRERTLLVHPSHADPVAVAWADARLRYRIPARYAHQLLDGVARDVETTRYQTFDDLAEYAYGVASTVGLMSMHIVGFDGAQAIPYAIKLGVALQLTNILRDVREDWQQGRLYLPLSELDRFGLHERDIAAGRVDDRWRAFMRFQIDRNHRLYTEAMPGIGMLHADGRFAIAAAAELYRAILEDIEAHDMDVFSRRAHVSRWGKLRRLPGIWSQAKRALP